jgi:aminoglycoside 3-N-acetyltransferase I
MRIEIQKIGPDQIDVFIELIRIFEDIFEMQHFSLPDTKHLQQLLNKDDFFVFVALSEGKIVGGLTAYCLDQYYSEAPLVYIYDLAVKSAFQRKGIGRKLISGITDYCKKIGIEEVFVQADEADTYALDFYRSTGARAEKVVHFYYPLNN